MIKGLCTCSGVTIAPAAPAGRGAQSIFGVPKRGALRGALWATDGRPKNSSDKRPAGAPKILCAPRPAGAAGAIVTPLRIVCKRVMK